jgi:hypothetical protein
VTFVPEKYAEYGSKPRTDEVLATGEAEFECVRLKPLTGVCIATTVELARETVAIVPVRRIDAPLVIRIGNRFGADFDEANACGREECWTDRTEACTPNAKVGDA